MLITAILTEHPQLSRYIFFRGPQVLRPLKARRNVRPERTLNASTHRCSGARVAAARMPPSKAEGATSWPLGWTKPGKAFG